MPRLNNFFCRFCVSVFVASSVTKLISKEGVDFKQKLRHVLYDVASTSVRACVRVCVCGHECKRERERERERDS